MVSFRDQKFNLLCNDVIRDPSNAASLRMARAIWWFYFSKCIEFMDTACAGVGQTPS